jgi:hypothetical protein
MRPDRMGKSKWAKVTPWYYAAKRKRARQWEAMQALVDEIGEARINAWRDAIAATGITTAEACANIEESQRSGALKAIYEMGPVRKF